MQMPPIEWLLDVSGNTLGDLELAELDRGSKRLKAAKAEWNAAVEHFARDRASVFPNSCQAARRGSVFLRPTFQLIDLQRGH
jgi:hypothetical protein